MTIRQITRMIRVFDNDAIPVDVSIDFSETLEPMFFEIEQEHSVFLSLEGIQAVYEAARKLKIEYEQLAKSKNGEEK